MKLTTTTVLVLHINIPFVDINVNIFTWEINNIYINMIRLVKNIKKICAAVPVDENFIFENVCAKYQLLYWLINIFNYLYNY